MAVMVLAGPVSREQALQTARDYLKKERMARSQSAAPELVLAYERLPKAGRGSGDVAPLYYVFNEAAGGGFVVVSGDDRVRPVMGVAERGSFVADSLPDGLKWEHNRDLIFQAGNEYHKYEILDVAYPTMGIDRIVWDGNNYQVYPYTCEPRLNYLYDEDANGAFYIRNSDNIENDISSEYVYVNYVLRVPERLNGEVYINGMWTYDQFTPEYMMQYDELSKCYTAKLFQKQGYYSYQYVLIGEDGVSCVVPSEGNFYQTENKYQALVYYRGQGERTDRLLGYQQVQIK